MSKQEAVLAYLKGSIGRRDFIQKLTIAGVSSAAAVTYANALKPGAALASGGANPGGLRRAFQEDDYGVGGEEPTEVPATPLEEALAALGAATSTLVDGVAGLIAAADDIIDSLGLTGDIAAQFTANLTNAIANLQAQIAALGLTAAPRSTSGVLALQGTSSDIMDVMSSVFNVLAGIYSDILKTSDDIERSATIAPFAIVAGRQASYFSTLLGQPAFPTAQEPSATAADLDAALAEIS